VIPLRLFRPVIRKTVCTYLDCGHEHLRLIQQEAQAIVSKARGT